jgi:hypothetical protein
MEFGFDTLPLTLLTSIVFLLGGMCMHEEYKVEDKKRARNSRYAAGTTVRRNRGGP